MSDGRQSQGTARPGPSVPSLTQHQQVLNRARDIINANTRSLSTNIPTSFRRNVNTYAHPKRPRLSAMKASTAPKEVCKTVVVICPTPNIDNYKEYPLTQEHIVCNAQVDFSSDDSESTTRDTIVQAVKTQLTGINPDDFEFVKVQNKRVTVTLVAEGYRWDFKHVKNLCGQGKLYVRLLREFPGRCNMYEVYCCNTL